MVRSAPIAGRFALSQHAYLGHLVAANAMVAGQNDADAVLVGVHICNVQRMDKYWLVVFVRV